MLFPARVNIQPDELSTRIDPATLRQDRSWRVDGGKRACTQQEAMGFACVVAESPHNFSTGIHVASCCEIAAGYIEGLKATVLHEVAVFQSCSQIGVEADDHVSIR